MSTALLNSDVWSTTSSIMGTVSGQDDQESTQPMQTGTNGFNYAIPCHSQTHEEKRKTSQINLAATLMT